MNWEKIEHYRKQVMKNRISLEQVPSEYRKKVELSIQSILDSHRAAYEDPRREAPQYEIDHMNNEQ